MPEQLPPPVPGTESKDLDGLGLARPRTEPDWTQKIVEAWEVSEEAAHQRLETFLAEGGGVYRYERGRPRADLDSNSRLSPYFRWGLLSPRALYWAVEDAQLPKKVCSKWSSRLPAEGLVVLGLVREQSPRHRALIHKPQGQMVPRVWPLHHRLPECFPSPLGCHSVLSGLGAAGLVYKELSWRGGGVPAYSTWAGAAPRAPGGARHGGGNRAVTSQPRTGQSTSYGDVKSAYGGAGGWHRSGCAKGAPRSANRQGEEQHRHTGRGSHTGRDEGEHSRQGRGRSKAGEGTRTGNQNGGDGRACAWEAATTKGMAWPASPVATGCQGNPCSTGIRWGVSPAAQMGCLHSRSGSPLGADEP